MRFKQLFWEFPIDGSYYEALRSIDLHTTQRQPC